jgi:hypothetical protein
MPVGRFDDMIASCEVVARVFFETEKLLLRARGAGVREQELVVADVPVVTVEGGEGVGGFFEHLFGHGDRIAELLEIE